MNAKRLGLLATALALVGLAAWSLAGGRHPLELLWPAKGGSDALVLSGNIEAHESVLSFKTVQSRIVDLPVSEGQWVRQGTVLAVVDASDYRQQMAVAQAGLLAQRQQLELALQNQQTAGRALLVDEAQARQSERDYRRALELQRQGFSSQAALDLSDTARQLSGAVLARDQSQQAAAGRSVEVARANVRSAEEALTLARVVVGYTTLTAPFDGVVSVRQAELGEVVVPGTPVLTLTDLDHVWLRAYLNEADLGRVRIGQELSISNDSYPAKRYAGRIAFIAQKAEFTPKSVETHAERVNLVYRVKIDIANPGHELVPGMPADARVQRLGAGS